jgi:hypothetical protein
VLERRFSGRWPWGGGAGGQPQLWAGKPKSPTNDAANLTQEKLQPVFTHAIALIATAGYNVSALSQVQFHVADLPGSLLGWTYQQNVWIDQNAARYGWYIDVSPGSSTAFARVTGTNEFQASATSPAYGHVDLDRRRSRARSRARAE